MLSDRLRSRYPECAGCEGSGEIDADYPAASFMRDEFDSIDLTKKAKTTCSACEGMGVQVPGFGLSRA